MNSDKKIDIKISTDQFEVKILRLLTVISNLFFLPILVKAVWKSLQLLIP